MREGLNLKTYPSEQIIKESKFFTESLSFKKKFIFIRTLIFFHSVWQFPAIFDTLFLQNQQILQIFSIHMLSRFSLIEKIFVNLKKEITNEIVK